MVTSVITIARVAPFTGPVALTVTGAPPGVIASVAPPGGGGTATLSVQSMAAATNGTYSLEVRGTAAGLADATTNINVTVTGGMIPNGLVSVEFCALFPPIWVAQQDGNGAWTRVFPNAGSSTYQFAFASAGRHRCRPAHCQLAWHLL